MRLTKKRKVLLLIIVAFLVVFIVFSYTPAKWLVRKNCLCGRAHDNPGVYFAQDDMLFRVIGEHGTDDEHISLTTAKCIHGEAMLIQLIGIRSYTVSLLSN